MDIKCPHGSVQVIIHKCQRIITLTNGSDEIGVVISVATKGKCGSILLVLRVRLFDPMETKGWRNSKGRTMKND
jgi:hypothetical protein